MTSLVNVDSTPIIHQSTVSIQETFVINVTYSITYLLFWYQVFTWVSDKLSFDASSMRSCTLRYFCRSKLFSKELSWWSVNAVLAFRGFLLDFNDPLSELGLGLPSLESSVIINDKEIIIDIWWQLQLFFLNITRYWAV